MLSKLKEAFFHSVTVQYYFIVSVLMLVLYFCRVVFTDMINEVFNSNMDPHGLLLIINILLLLYIPLVYSIPYFIRLLLTNDKNHDSVPDVLFIDPYQLFQMSQWSHKHAKHKK